MLDSWLFTRLGVLSKERLAAKEQWCRRTVDFAFETWQAAANSEDLKPALNALAEVKRLEPASWGDALHQ
jgi:hypothetical protein